MWFVDSSCTASSRKSGTRKRYSCASQIFGARPAAYGTGNETHFRQGVVLIVKSWERGSEMVKASVTQKAICEVWLQNVIAAMTALYQCNLLLCYTWHVYSPHTFPSPHTSSLHISHLSLSHIGGRYRCDEGTGGVARAILWLEHKRSKTANQ